jgi:hypothetical protein
MSNPTYPSAVLRLPRLGARSARPSERLWRAERASGDREQRLLAEAYERRFTSVCRHARLRRDGTRR